MSKAKIVCDAEGRFYGIRIDCPGCKLLRPRFSGGITLPVDWLPAGKERSPHAGKGPWGFNGDLHAPTFTPSLKTVYGCQPGCERHESGECQPQEICHSYIRNGKIEFLDDCTHNLKGQTVDLPDIPDDDE